MIHVVENFLSKSYQNLLERDLMSDGFDLYIGYKGTVLITDSCAFPNETTIETPQLTHTFVDNGRFNTTWGIVSPIAFKLIEHLGEDYIPVKAKMNINFQNRRYGKDNHYCPHIDFPILNCITAVYYINDSDGDTLFFNKTINGLEVIQRVTPKKGMLVYFDSNIIHAGQPPTNTALRALINFNLIKQS